MSRRIIVISSLVLFLALALVLGFPSIKLWYLQRFRGAEMMREQSIRTQKLELLWILLSKYHQRYGEWPNSDAQLESLDVQVEWCLGGHTWAREARFRVLYERLDQIGVEPPFVIVEDPGFDWPGTTGPDDDWGIVLLSNGVVLKKEYVENYIAQSSSSTASP